MQQEELDTLFHRAITLVAHQDDQGQLQELIDKGLEIDRLDEYGQSLAERSLFGAINFRSLYALWKAGATPATPYLQEIFSLFQKGKPIEVCYAEAEAKKRKQQAKEISPNFSAKKLKLQSAHLNLPDHSLSDRDPEFELTLDLAPFLFEGHYTETQLVFVGELTEEMEAQCFETEGYTFEEELEPASIYIQHAHNPIDLKRLALKRGRKYLTLEMELYLDVEYERTDYPNETIVWTYKQER